ncbi:hypothetical protein MRX96_033605 [Rhipicephalus microplus]
MQTRTHALLHRVADVPRMNGSVAAGGSRCQATLFVRRGPKRKKGPGSVLRRRLASFLPPRASASDSVNDRWEMGIHSHLYTIRRRPPFLKQPAKERRRLCF